MSLLISASAFGLEATYQVKFIGNFTSDIFPGENFPGNPHFSPVNVVSHNKSYKLFPKGTVATEGVKVVAETGNPGPLSLELEAAQNINDVFEYQRTSPLDGDQVASLQITVKKEAPFISVLSMIAPSPDWVVGLNSVKLFKKGRFIQRLYAPLYAIDAGTDSGQDYKSVNESTLPQEKIHRLKYIAGKRVKKPFAFVLIQKLP